jgi:hypothetical protein
MKKAILLFVLLAISTITFAQRKTKKLSAEESSKMTSDQRLVHETQRKSKNGKKDMSLKKKIRTEEKNDRKARKMKGNKRPKGY